MQVLNFQSNACRLRMTMQVVFAVSLAVAVGLLLWAVVEAYYLNLEKDTLDQAVARQQAEIGDEMIPVATLLSMSEQAASLNKVIGQKGEPLPAVLDEVTAALLVNVRLDRFEYSATEGAATLEAVSPSTVDLADFVSHLEAASSIDRVVVARQEKDQTSQSLNRYEIFLTAESR